MPWVVPANALSSGREYKYTWYRSKGDRGAGGSSIPSTQHRRLLLGAPHCNSHSPGEQHVPQIPSRACFAGRLDRTFNGMKWTCWILLFLLLFAVFLWCQAENPENLDRVPCLGTSLTPTDRLPLLDVGAHPRIWGPEVKASGDGSRSVCIQLSHETGRGMEGALRTGMYVQGRKARGSCLCILGGTDICLPTGQSKHGSLLTWQLAYMGGSRVAPHLPSHSVGLCPGVL